MAKSVLINLLSAAAFLCLTGAAASRDLSDCENGKAASAVAGSLAAAEHDCADTAEVRQGKAQAPLAKVMIKPQDIPPGAEDAPSAAPNTGSLMRAKDFVVLVKRPENADGETLVLLHGSGGDETTLMSLAARIAPRSVLMGVRGRLTQDGKKRWYRRLTPTSFDQSDIRHEAAAFADFLQDAVEKGTLDPDHTTFIGYSNGANLLAALTVLHPGLVERAVLLRPMSVLADIPQSADLSQLRVLMVAGASDLVYSPFAPMLEAMLRDHGARIDAHMIKANHGLSKQDVLIASEWLHRSNAISLNQ
jgi:predicted esterase